MITIFQIIDNMGVGGAQAMLFETYHSIAKYYPECHQHIIYADKRYYDAKFVESSGVNCQFINDHKKISQMITKSKNPVILFHKLASSRHDMIERIKKATKCPIVAINHTLYNTISWKKSKCVDMMISVSSHMGSKLNKWYPNMPHISVRNGVNGFRYDKIESKKVDLSKNRFRTGRLNRICGWKHSTSFVDWCKKIELPIKMDHYYLGGRIGGRGGDKPSTQKARNKVHLLGNISDFNTKVSIIKSWDITLYATNREEGISVAILESLACGIPCIISNHNGNTEVISDGINGYIFKDYKQAQKILTDLVSSPKKLKELKRTTKEHFEKHLDAKYMVDKYMDVIYQVMGRKKKETKPPVEVVETPTVEKIETKPVEIIEVKPIIDKNKFTIITSSYNKEKYLKEWSKSILRQSYRPLEVIFANDKSTDNTLEVINGIKNKFKKNNIKFKLVNNEKQLYCGGSYHNITNYINGYYVGVLDADDMLEKNAIEHIMNLYKKNPDIYWIYSQFLWCNEEMQNGRRGLNSCPKKGESLLDLGDRGVHGIGSGFRTFSIKIERPDKLFGRHLTCAVDKNMGYRLEEFGPGLFTEQICYLHRGHPIGSLDSVSSTKEAMKMWQKVIKEAHKRRQKYKKTIYRIVKER